MAHGGISVAVVEALESRLLFSAAFPALSASPPPRGAPVAEVHAAQRHTSQIARAAKRAVRLQAAQARRLARQEARAERKSERARSTSATPAVPAVAAAQPVLPEPASSDPSFQYQAFSNDALFAPGGPSENDIIQGDIGDCYFLATLSAVARTDPQLIRDSIAQLSNGDFEVTFHRNGQTVNEIVDDELPVTSTGNLAYAQLGQDSSMWVAIMEKAYCAFRPGANDSYTGIAAGWMDDAFEALGALPSDVAGAPSAGALLAEIQSDLTAGQAVTIGIAQAEDGAPLVGNHVYTVDSVNTSSPGGPTLTIRNPWGYSGAGSDPTGSADVTITAQQAANSMSGIVSAIV
ncbi:MAG TPA: C2 family cysteine protease [Tepidisphaeraceae bacterium]|jgi:hypothetical protein|nr:C2 family cysteine protease [Tepidisphaeraceae bacterium]